MAKTKLESLFDQLKPVLLVPKRNIIIGEPSMDGDSFGAIIGMANILESNGHSVDIVAEEPSFEDFFFLPGTDKIKKQKIHDIDWNQYDNLWLVDIGNMGRTTRSKEPVKTPGNLKIIVVDHHQNEYVIGNALNVVDTDAKSACCVVYELYKYLNIPLTPYIANVLLTGHATDTGFFMYYFDARTFATAAGLIEAGADYRNIVYKLQRSYPPEQIKYFGEAFSRLKIDDIAKVAYITVENDLWKRYEMLEDNRYGSLSFYPQSIKDMIFGLVITEPEPNQIRCRLATRYPELYNAGDIAVSLGGGGHAAVASIRMKDTPLDEAVKIIIDALRKEVTNNPHDLPE